MPYQYRDIREFQKMHPGREEKAKILKTLSEEEIRHLAGTCGNITAAACFMTFVSRVRKAQNGT